MPALDYVVNQAGKADIMSFFGAGNNGTDTTASAVGSTTSLESPYAVVITATNDKNEYASFSNWNETAVDFATPGANILSTVSKAAGGSSFNVKLVEDAGTAGSLTYYKDFSDFGTADASGETLAAGNGTYRITAILPGAEGNIPLEYGTDYTFELDAETEDLQVGIDAAQLNEKYGDQMSSLAGATVQILLSWDAGKLFEHEDPSSSFAVSVIPTIDMESYKPSVASEGLAAAVLVQLTNADEGNQGSPYLVSYAQQTYDNYTIDNSYPGVTTQPIDTEASITANVLTAIPLASLAGKTGDQAKMTVALSGLGIANLTDGEAPPYALMSGTSMATPAATGSYVLLKSLYPDESPLELRGLMVGSTAPIPTADYGGKNPATATDGAFTFDLAVTEDETQRNANTWSVTADTEAFQVTLHGYNLDEVESVSLDGDDIPASDFVEQTENAIVLNVPKEAFDGAQHRFDVTDGSSERVHKASYTLPFVEAGEPSMSEDVTLQRLVDLTHSGAGILVGASDRVFYADPEGAFLYSCTDPAAEGAVWIELAAPGTPDQLPFPTLSSTLSFVYRDGTLGAYTIIAEDAEEEGSATKLAVYGATYDIASNTWGSFERLFAEDPELSAPMENASTSLTTFAPFTCAGQVHFVLGYAVSGTYTESSSAGAESFSVVWRQNADGSFEKLPDEDGILEGQTAISGFEVDG